MVAYSFQPRFLNAIRAGEKRQTIRLPRKRHARAGEELQLFTGPRMKPVRVGAAWCDRACEVRLDFLHDEVTLVDAIRISGMSDLDDFAVRDGFRPPPHLSHVRPWRYMKRWWSVTHADQNVFLGVLVEWGESFKPAAAAIPRACRQCGCTETNACTVRWERGHRGCAWVEPDLCDSCANPSIRVSGPRPLGSAAA